MNRIVLFGKNGQIGWELQRALTPLAELIAFDSTQADFSCPELLTALLDEHQPDVIVNAAAYTAVDSAEINQALAHTINATAVGVLAQWAAAHQAWLVHYSTDYVFSGDGDQPDSEGAATAPLSVYGQSKLEGERLIQQSKALHLILRTSWVYAARGRNFPKTMLKLAQSRDTLKVIADQWGCPTSAELIADVTSLCLYKILNDPDRSPLVSGTYHLTAHGAVNWCEYARFVIAQSQLHGWSVKTTPQSIIAIPTSEYPLPARRPLNSRLNTEKICRTFGVHLPDWRIHVQRLVAELCTAPLN